jgi:hypothetical protein
VVVSIMLLSALTFIMTLFYLVNFPNPNIVRHSWNAISATICIFCAVLIFNASNGFITWEEGEYDDGVHEPEQQQQQGGLEDTAHGAQDEPHQLLVAKANSPFSYSIYYATTLMAKSGGDDHYTYSLFGFGFLQFLFWIFVYEFALAYCSGVLNLPKCIRGREEPADKKEEPAAGDKDETESLARAKEYFKSKKEEDKKLTLRSAAHLLSHIAGFSAINAFGMLMELPPFNTSWMHALSVLIITGLTLLSILFLGSKVRSYAMNKNAKAEDLHLLEEEAVEGGNDMMSLCISFLTVQVLRYAISGIQPDTHGGEPDEHLGSHSNVEIGVLIGCAFVAAALCATVLVLRQHCIKSHIGLRLATIFQMTFAMIKSWCFFFGGVWLLAATDLAEMLDVYEDSALLKVILAMCLSVYAISLIISLDKLAESECTGPMVDDAIYTFQGGLGILIGFAWEQAFERSVSTVVQAAGDVPAPILKGLLAFFLVLLVLPAWRIWIMRSVMRADTQSGHTHSS